MDFFGEPEPAPAPEPPSVPGPAASPSGARTRRTRRARSDADAGTDAGTAAEPAAASADPEGAADGETLRPSPPAPASFAAQATNPDLADFVAALGDEQLGYLAVTVSRALRQRLGGRRRRGAGPDALARAARLVATELAVPGADGGGDLE
jgi:hypothetical protein